MAFTSGTVTGSGNNDQYSGHKNLLMTFNTFVTTGLPAGQNWVVSRAVANVVGIQQDYEIQWIAPGISGQEAIFLGIKTYQDATVDYYNFKVGVFTGYVAGNSFETQAGSSPIMGCTLWNQSIDYWFIADGQRAIVVIKILDVYESFYIGKYLPYATPTQYPYPVAIWASMPTAAYLRYSDTTLISGFKGTRANFVIRDVSGIWIQPDCYPYSSTTQLRNTTNLSTNAAGYYGLHSIILSNSTPNVYGELSGIYYITGFNNATENTIVLNGFSYMVFRDRRSVGFNDYIAVRLS